MSDKNANQVLTTARTAFKKFQSGWASGDFSDYLALITDDFEFSFPTGEHRGVFTGNAGREKMIAKCRDDAASGARLTLSEPRTVAVDGQTVIFEFESAGDLDGQPYKGRNIIVLEIHGERVQGYREYFGDLDPKLFGGDAK